MNFQEFIKDPKVPDWVRKHPIFKDIASSDKIFPLIGLSNFQQEVAINVDDSFYQVVRTLIAAIWGQLENAHYAISQTKRSNQIWNGVKYLELSAEQKIKVAAHLHLLEQGYRQFDSSTYATYVAQQKTTQKLSLLKDITYPDKKIFVKEGEGIFKVYGKFAALIEDLHKMVKLDQTQAFKDYSTANFSGKMQVVFSAADKEGAWDILTMSMRGIQSCQSWNGQYHKATIGSMLDPFTGIIYLTTGAATPHGSKMLRRCVVRFVVNSETRQPAIFLEFMYPGSYDPALKVFQEVIAAKISKKIPIIDWKTPGLSKYYVPYSESTKALLKHSLNPKCANAANQYNQMTILPYRDTYIEYKVKKDKDDLYNQQIEKELAALKSTLSGLVFSKTKFSPSFLTTLDGILAKTLNSEISLISKENLTDCKSYMRKVYMCYFSNKSKIIKTLKEELTKHPAMKNLLKKEVKDTSLKKAAPFFSGTKKLPKGQKLPKEKITATVATKKSPKKASLTTFTSSIDKDFIPLLDKEIKARWKKLIVNPELNKVANAKN